MSNCPWKSEERHAAAQFGGKRFPASTGGVADFETAEFVGQVKHIRHLSLAALEDLALEIEHTARRRRKIGVVVVKRRAGRGSKTPRLIILTEPAWRQLKGQGRATPPRQCLWCGRLFVPDAWRCAFCSVRCRRRADRMATDAPLVGPSSAPPTNCGTR